MTAPMPTPIHSAGSASGRGARGRSGIVSKPCLASCFQPTARRRCADVLGGALYQARGLRRTIGKIEARQGGAYRTALRCHQARCGHGLSDDTPRPCVGCGRRTSTGSRGRSSLSSPANNASGSHGRRGAAIQTASRTAYSGGESIQSYVPAASGTSLGKSLNTTSPWPAAVGNSLHKTRNASEVSP